MKKLNSLVKIFILCTILVFNIDISNAQNQQNEQIKKGEILSLPQCVSIAINNSPIIKQHEYNLQVARSNLGIAKAAYFPTIGGGVGVYQEYNGNKRCENGSSYRNLPSASVYLNQLLWNFGKSNSIIRMEHFYKIAAEYEFMDSICDTMFNVKRKYFEVLRTKAIIEIEQNNVLVNQKNVEMTKQFYQAGRKPQIDYVDAQVYLNEAHMRLIEAQNNYKLALADLGNVLYVAYAPDFSIGALRTFNFHDTFIPNTIKNEVKSVETIPNDKIINVAYKGKIAKNTNTIELPFTLDEAYDMAYDNSPDLWVLEVTVKAMQQALIYAKRQYFPEITGNIGYGYANTKEYSNHGMSMYLDMSTAVNLKALKHDIDKAQANVDLAATDVLLFKQNLYFEVQKCYYNVNKSQTQISIAKTKAEQALEDFNITSDRYAKGQTDYIALQQSRKNYNDAKILYVGELYNYNVDLANLEIAMHYHMDDLHAQVEHALKYHYKELLNNLEASMRCEHKHEEEGSDKDLHHDEL